MGSSECRYVAHSCVLYLYQHGVCVCVCVPQVAAANGYESVIEPVCGRVEELTLRERVDVMVSDWPGHALLAGGMLPALAHAR